MLHSEIAVAQFGKVVALPAEPGTSQSMYALKLYEALGAPQEISVESTAVSAATIESIGAAAGAVVDIESKRREVRQAEEEADSEKAKLTKEVEILRLEKEKKDLLDALAQ